MTDEGSRRGKPAHAESEEPPSLVLPLEAMP
jgi:hypothetical protein